MPRIKFFFQELNTPFFLRLSKPTLAESKSLIIEKALDNQPILRELTSNCLAKTTKYIKKVDKIKEKLQRKLNRLFRENSFEKPENEDLTDEETKILLSSTQFMFSGELITKEQELLTFDELNIHMDAKITILFDIMKGIEENPSLIVDEITPSPSAGTIRVALILLEYGNGQNGDLRTSLGTKKNFLGSDFEIVYCFDDRYDAPNILSTITSWNLDKIDCFFVGVDAPSEFCIGDHLKTVLEQGKGIVFSCFCNDDEYFGGIDGELPIKRGPQQGNDGPFFLNKKKSKENHPILKNVSSFSGGKGSYRSKMTIIPPKKDEIIEVVGKWEDKDQDPPLVVTKEYKSNGGRGGWGRIVVLNMNYGSSRVDKFYWNAETDGDVIMQNSIIWASKND